MVYVHIKRKCHTMSSYLEEHFIRCQTENVCKFTGYTSDLKHLLPDNKQASLSLFLFDEIT